MIKCSTNKKVYLTLELAEEALVQAHTRVDYRKGDGPMNVYRCDDCGYFHLTSQGQMNERLLQEYKNGNIGRQKLADQWNNKWKK